MWKQLCVEISSLNTDKKGRQGEDWATEVRTGGEHSNPFFIKGRGQYALTSHPLIIELLLAFRHSTYVLIMLFCFCWMHQMEKDRTHLWFRSMFSWHWSRTLACYSNMKLPPKRQEAAQPLFGKWLLLCGSFPVSGQGRGLPEAGSQQRDISLANTYARILHCGMSLKCFSWLHI